MVQRGQWSVECSNVFLSVGNNPGVLKNSTKHAEPLFVTFRQFAYTSNNQSDCENLVKNCLNYNDSKTLNRIRMFTHE